MAAKLGSDDVSFRLGAGEVAAVYLGTQEVWSAVPVAATLYYNATEAFSWTTVGNWWLDAGLDIPAGRLPTAIDSVVASSGVMADGQTVVNFTSSNGGLSGTLTVTGMATFNNSSANFGNITGNATFNDSSENKGGENFGITTTVTGNATFNDSSANRGIVTGDATFTGSACNSGTVNGSIIGSPASCP
jgi:hypothetical protein